MRQPVYLCGAVRSIANFLRAVDNPPLPCDKTPIFETLALKNHSLGVAVSVFVGKVFKSVFGKRISVKALP